MQKRTLSIECLVKNCKKLSQTFISIFFLPFLDQKRNILLVAFIFWLIVKLYQSKIKTFRIHSTGSVFYNFSRKCWKSNYYIWPWKWYFPCFQNLLSFSSDFLKLHYSAQSFEKFIKLICRIEELTNKFESFRFFMVPRLYFLEFNQISLGNRIFREIN